MNKKENISQLMLSKINGIYTINNICFIISIYI